MDVVLHQQSALSPYLFLILMESLEGMRVSRPKTTFMDFTFEQNGQGNREPVKILVEELERVTHCICKYVGTSIEDEGGKWRSQSRWEPAGEIGRNAVEYCATEGCQQQN